ncbi:MAG: hypothetical protein RID11_18495 [Roseovarius sp.]|jgi:hypothetical protein|uniref:hypothetical protein n=1 Tax=Roseovarius sp. TaxID=1486281 RepID=UPI0032EB1340
MELMSMPSETAGVAKSKTKTAIDVAFIVLAPVLQGETATMMAVSRDIACEQGYSLAGNFLNTCF